MKKLLAALAAATFMTFAYAAPVAAQQACVPVTALINDLVKAQIPPDNVFATKDVGVINAYIGALGIGIPDGSVPIGLITVEIPHQEGVPDRVFIALVEQGDCIRHTGVVQLSKHKLALDAALAGV